MRKSVLVMCLALPLGAALLLGVACSDDSEVTGPSSSGTTGAGATGGSGGSGGSGGLFVNDSGTCNVGDSCGDGGVCTEGGVCCEQASACGPHCCNAAEICSFQTCVTPGGECVDATDCGADEYCEYALGEPVEQDAGAGGACQGGVIFQTGKCLPKPPQCDPGEDPGDPPTCLEQCEYMPPLADFEPELKFAWGSVTSSENNVMMTPIVAQLDDDNCDGHIDERDIPEILFTSFGTGGYVSAGVLRAISIVGGAVVEKWSTSGISGGRQLAAGNIDGQPGNEVIACGVDGTTVYAFNGDGSVRWTGSAPLICFQPAIADLDADGTVEIVVDGGILDGATGIVEATFSPVMDGTFLVSDVTGSGTLEVVANTQLYDFTGNQILHTGGPQHAWTGGTHFRSGPAIADLDLDGTPEIIAVYFYQHQLAIWRYDPAQPTGVTFIRNGIDINGTLNPALCPAGSAGSQWGGGPVTVGDFNSDGFPDVALAGGVGYAVFDGQKLMDPTVADQDTFMWVKQTIDCSSAGTGSSLFDFDGDGNAEVIYGDELYLRIYEGATGTVLFETCNTSGTLSEYPLVADVDNDGHADIVVASNSYSSYNCGGTKTTGIRIFGDTLGKWVRTRSTWNEHAYHVTNVGDDGSIPTPEPPNYLDPDLNNFRQNVQPQGEFSAPDLTVSVFPACAGEYGLVGRVRNIGEASVPPGVDVGFYEGDPPSGTSLGVVQTTQTLYSLGSEDVLLPLTSEPVGLVYAVVDDGSPPHAWHECRTDNNTSAAVQAACGSPR